MSDLLRKIALAKVKPDELRDITPGDLVDLVIGVMQYVTVIDQAIKDGKIKGDKGDTPIKGKDYQSLETTRAELNAFLDQVETKVAETDKELSRRLTERLKTIKNGKDAEITDEMLEGIAEAAAELIEMPETRAFLEPIAIRDSLEVLTEDERLSIESISGLDDYIKNLVNQNEPRRPFIAGGAPPLQLYIDGVKKSRARALNVVGATFAEVNGLPTLTITGSSGSSSVSVDGTEVTDPNFIGGTNNTLDVSGSDVTINTDLSAYDTSIQVDAKITNLVDSAPGALDTLNELAEALGDDPNFATTVTNSLATKATKTGLTENYIPVMGSSDLEDSPIYSDGTNVGIGRVPETRFDVYTTTNTSGKFLSQIVNLDPTTAESYGLLVRGGAGAVAGRTFEVQDYAGNTDLIVSGDGKVSIGYDAGSDMLNVAGDVTLGTGNTHDTTLAGRLIGGLGAVTTGGVADFDNVTNSRSGSGHNLLRGSLAANGATAMGTNYFHTFNFEYAYRDGTGTITQFAIPYGVSGSLNAGVFFRGRYSSSWTDWNQLLHIDSAGEVSNDITFTGTIDLPGYVTTNTTQTITGQKTFNEFVDVDSYIQAGENSATSGNVLLQAKYNNYPAQALITQRSSGAIGLSQYMYQDGSATWKSAYGSGAISRGALFVNIDTLSFITASSQDVALGGDLTSQPTEVFKVEGDGDTTIGRTLTLDTDATDTKILFGRSTGNNYSFQHDDARFYLYNNSQAAFPFTVLNTGEVGIGTANPGAEFEVINGARNIQFDLPSGGSPTIKTTLGSGSDIVMYNSANGDMEFNVNFGSGDIALNPGSSGFVRTNRPVEVGSYLELTSTNYQIRIIDTGDASNEWRLGTANDTDLGIYRNTTEVARFEENGNFALGRTSATRLFHMEGTDDVYLRAQSTGTNSDVGIELHNDSQEWYIKNWGGSSDWLMFYDDTNNDQRITIKPLSELVINEDGNAFDFRVEASGKPNAFVVNGTTGDSSFDGTVSGSDPVNSDDFVTKGYADTNYSGGGGSGISNVVEDTTPQLGGDLDLNGNDITFANVGDFVFKNTAGGVAFAVFDNPGVAATNYISFNNGGAAEVPYLFSTGTDSNVGMEFYTKGSGVIWMGAEVSVGGNKITNLDDGTVDSDAVNKGQLDAAVAPPYAHLILSTAQNHGGANGSVTYINWDGTPINKDTGITHSTSTNPSRVEVDADGVYSLVWMMSATQGGSSRTTLKSRYRINGSTVVERGAQRNYSRGSAYGDISVGMVTEVTLTAGDYIEVGTEVEDTDATYTINSIPAECELIIRKIA